MSRRFSVGALGCLVAFVVSATAARGADWPQWRGPRGDGVSPDAQAPLRWGPDENIAWKTPLPGPGASSPVVASGRVYLACYSGYNVPGQEPGEQDSLRLHLVCLDASSGKILWTADAEPKLPEQERIREGHGYASGTPAVDADRIYVAFGKAGVFAFDRDGKKLWRADIGDGLNGWGSAVSPVLHGDLVIVNASVESRSVIALDRKTGKEVWRAGDIREAWNVPTLVPLPQGKAELVVPMLGQVVGLDPDSGEKLWTCQNDIKWYIVPSVVADKGVLWSIGGRSGTAAAAIRAGGRGDVTADRRLWIGAKGSNVSSPIHHHGKLYWVNDSSGVAGCADAETGKLLYEERLPRGGQFYASAVMAGDKIYYLSRTGKTFVVAAKPEFELLATNDLGERGMFNASPAIVAGRLYIRSDKFLYCIGGK